jgi:2-methylcitrate dehydratase
VSTKVGGARQTTIAASSASGSRRWGLAYPATAFAATHGALLAMRGITGPREVLAGNACILPPAAVSLFTGHSV